MSTLVPPGYKVVRLASWCPMPHFTKTIRPDFVINYFLKIIFIIIFIFSVYEIFERNWLITNRPDLLPLLHMVRGLGTSLAVALFAILMFLRFNREFSDASLDILSSQISLARERSHRLSGLWFIKVRWIVIGMALLLVVVGTQLIPILPQQSFFPLIATLFILLIMNGIYFWFTTQTTFHYQLVMIQILGDVLALVALCHYSGGIENPIYLVAVFPVIVAGILLRPQDAAIITVATMILFAGLTALETQSLIPHYSLLPFHSAENKKIFYAFNQTGLFLAVLLMITLFGIRIRQRIYFDEIAMVQTGKLAAMGELLSTIAHEVNNPLAIVMGKLHLLLEDASVHQLNNRVQEELKKITTEVEDISGLLRNMLSFSRCSTGRRELCDLNHLIRQVLSMMESHLAHSQIRMLFEPDPKLPNTIVNPNEIKQAFLNLINNACDAMPRGGTLTIKTSLDASYIRVAIEDSGQGMPAEVLDKIFEPFYTTKPEGKGTGLGLYVTRELIRSYEGNITINSRSGAGTCVTLFLPGV